MDKKAEVIDKFKRFIDSLKKEDIVGVLHHTDPDGVCSGVIISKLVEKTRGKKIDFHLSQIIGNNEQLEENIKLLEENKVNKLISVDLGLDQTPELVKKMEKFAELLVIDHHKVYNNISSRRTVFIKPQFFSDIKPSFYPAAKLCFDLALEHADISELDWVAAVGIIGDCGFTEWKEFLDEVFEKYNIEKKQDIFETDTGRAASLISNTESFDLAKIYDAFEIVYDASGVQDVLESELKKYREIVDSEIIYWIDHVNEFAETTENMIFYVIKSKYKIKGPLSTRLSLIYPGKTIIIVQDLQDGIIGVSARRRDEKVAVNELLENSVKGIEGAGAGGHMPAAAGRILKKDFDEFKEKLFELSRNG